MLSAYFGMPRDTSLRVDADTHQRFTRLASTCGITTKRLLWLLARHVQWSDVIAWNGKEVARLAKRRKEPQPSGKVAVMPNWRDEVDQQQRASIRKAVAPDPED